jgi:hypothetical protein
VADVFDALTSDRCYRAGVPPHEGYKFIVDRTGREFDPEVVEVFQSAVAPFPPGSAVVLSDGSAALIKEVFPGSVLRPIVRVVADPDGRRVDPWEIDLRRTADLSILRIAEQPVPA